MTSKKIHIRHAGEADLPAIIDLLRLSLGETSSEKSVRYWRWKHVDNPFGESPVLVAEAGGQLVGVRAFMRWRWCDGARSYSALRAVDTATHPGFRGQGIFRRLTTQLLEECKQAGDDFIFNTPNEQSRPGYLKMGWQELGKIRVRLKIRRPLEILRRKFVDIVEAEIPLPLDKLDRQFGLSPAMDRLGEAAWLESLRAKGERIYTPVSIDYLRWRYQHCPVQRYWAASGSGHLLIFYPRKQSIGLELRITECFYRSETDREELQRDFRKLITQLQPAYISAAPHSGGDFLNKNLFLPAMPVGPVLTFRPLNQEVIPIQKWRYSLGELELF